MFIPDTQVRPGVDTRHIDWEAQAVVAYLPDVIVVAGDWWDMPSLNSHVDAGSLEKEGSRIRADIEVGNEAFARFVAPMQKEIARRKHGHRNRWNPRCVFLFGNHEKRVDTAVNSDPRLQGMISRDQMLTPGFERHEFLTIVEIDGIAYSHYFQNQKSSRPLGGSIDARLNKIGRSFVQGHEQGLLYGIRQLPGNRVQHGLVAGSNYLHDEKYRGPQANGEWRGIVCLNEVRNGGDYDLMPLSMDYLRRKFG